MANLFYQRRRFCYAAPMRMPLWIVGLLLAVKVSGAEISFNFSGYPEGAVPTNFQAVLAGGGQPGA